MSQADPCNCDQALDLTKALESCVAAMEEAERRPRIHRALEKAERTLRRWNPIVTVEVERTVPARVETLQVDIQMGKIVEVRGEDGEPYWYTKDVEDDALKKYEEQKER